jgi:hypothetical protein
MVGWKQRLEDTMAGGRIGLIDGLRRYRFGDNVGDELEQAMPESRVLFGPLPHLFEVSCALDPDLCMNTSAKRHTMGGGKLTARCV